MINFSVNMLQRELKIKYSVDVTQAVASIVLTKAGLKASVVAIVLLFL